MADLVCYSRHCLNNGPFNVLNHLNTKLVPFSDPLCVHLEKVKVATRFSLLAQTNIGAILYLMPKHQINLNIGLFSVRILIYYQVLN